MESNNQELWNKEIDSFLRTLVSLHGTKDWEKIASFINIGYNAFERSPQDCKERWHFINFNDSKESWTDKEELRLIKAHKQYQNKWVNIAIELNGRSNNSIKNRFYSIFRKIKNKITRNDYLYTSKLELAEASYVMSLMKTYCERPHPVKERGGKRGTDFIFSLLKGVRLQEIIDYKGELLKRGINEVTPEDLWKEMEEQVKEPIESEQQITPDDIAIPTTEELFLIGQIWKLPPLIAPRVPVQLTKEEKRFVQTQFFRNKESLSAGISACSPFFLNSVMQTPVILSAETQLSTTKRFEGFSDFTDMTKIKRSPNCK